LDKVKINGKSDLPPKKLDRLVNLNILQFQPVIQQLNDKSVSENTLILVSQKTFNHRIIVAISSATHTLHRFTFWRNLSVMGR